MRRSKAAVALALVATLAGPSLVPTGAAAARGDLKGAAYSLGIDTFEPTLGATANGDLYFSITPSSPGVAIGWTASTAKSTDGGKNWADIGPKVGDETMPPETNDPYIYVDPGTGRIFQFHMSPILTCSILSWSDDGGKTWQTNPVGCSPTGVWDHQTIVAAKPRTVETSGYPNVLVQCVNAVYALMCARSLDGGSTWLPVEPVYINDYLVTGGCGAQTGHLTAAPDGTIYLPTSVCGTNPTVFISKDDGATWTRSVMSKMDTPFVDPSVSVDSKGNVYGTWIDNKGFLHMAVRRNSGKSWSKSVEVAPKWTANMPVIVAGDPGKIVVAYPSTNDLRNGYETKGYSMRGGDPNVVRKVAWGANLTVSTNALDAKPSFETVVATGSDPLGRGAVCVAATRCDILVDFIEAVIGPDGRPYAAFVDGCTGKCSKSADAPNDPGTGTGLMATLVSGPRLCASLCWRYEAARGKVAAAIALLYGVTNYEPSDAVGFTVTEMSRELQRLREQATRSRIEAVTGR
ncbi:MAG: glycoside hydrolase [Actinomycetota bacterium]|nr:glycoside hydrolase [Actinomycetota bacterium]